MSVKQIYRDEVGEGMQQAKEYEDGSSGLCTWMGGTGSQ